MTNWRATLIFVPLTYNDGKPVEDEHITYIKDYATDLFGGCTIFESVEGEWKSPKGERYCDQMMIVLVVAAESPDLDVRIDQLGIVILARCKQEMVFTVSLLASVQSVEDTLREAIAA
jgi:hypothetical protein